jgi:hypothetical protein
MVHGLRPFGRNELVLGPAQGWEVLRFFFPEDVGRIRPEKLSVEDRLFAQALLVAAIDETRRHGPAEHPEEVPLVAAGMIRLLPVARRVAALGTNAWFDVAAPEGCDPARIDEQARADVSTRHRAGWIAHVKGAPLL